MTTPSPFDLAWEFAPDEDNTRARGVDALVDDAINYRVLADTVVNAFNPPDDDVAEIALLGEALDRVHAFVVALPCVCPPSGLGEDDEPCGRCIVLGRAYDKPVDR